MTLVKVKGSNLYWTQIVFGVRNGSDGSGSIMSFMKIIQIYCKSCSLMSCRLAEEDIQRLRAMDPPPKNPRLLRQDNLELRRQSSGTGIPKLRASSPIDQDQGPLIGKIIFKLLLKDGAGINLFNF